jgi:carbon-monoxide dehydrogenase medium subunit
LKEFRQYVVARTPQEATGLKRSIGPAALYIAGGTSFVPFVKTPVEVLIDIGRLGYSGVVVGGGRVAVGATTRIADLMVPELMDAAPILHKTARRLATPLVRNVATPGGNMAYAFLPSDFAVAFLAAGAEIEILGENPRTVGAEDLLSDGWLGGDDLVSKITLPAKGSGQGSGFVKFGKSEVDIALVNAAVWLDARKGEVRGLRIAVGQTSSMPAFLKDIAEGVAGEKVTRGLIEKIARKVAGRIEPRDDHRASGDYRRHLIEVMVSRAFSDAAGEAGIEIAD